MNSWIGDRIKTELNNQLEDYEAKRRDMLRTLDSRIHEASEQLRSLKSEITEAKKQKDPIIKEVGDLKILKVRFDAQLSELATIEGLYAELSEQAYLLYDQYAQVKQEFSESTTSLKEHFPV